MLTLVTGPSGVGKSAVLTHLGYTPIDFDAYVVERFNLPVVEACTRFDANIEDEWPRYVDFIRNSGIDVVSDCCVTVANRKRYLDTFGPMYLIYLTASLPTLLERNRNRGMARIDDRHIIEKYLAQELPQPGEGWMAIYIRSTEDGNVEAYDGEETMNLLSGGKYDMIVSDEEWAAAGYSAHRNERGDIVLGLSEEQAKAAGAGAIRAERDIRLAKCDHISPMRWEEMTYEQRAAWRDYRRALLNMPEMDGFPWRGVIDDAPWPKEPY